VGNHPGGVDAIPHALLPKRFVAVVSVMVDEIVANCRPGRVTARPLGVQRNGVSVREDTELLAFHEGRADTGPRREMLGFRGLSVGADDPAAVQEVPVGAADAWLAPAGDGGDCQGAHTLANLDDLFRVQRAFARPNDRLEVTAGTSPRRIEQGLEGAELVRSFEHTVS